MTIEEIVSIHAPHAGRDRVYRCRCKCGKVSIHAPHAGRDSSFFRLMLSYVSFNPRAPCGARRFQTSHR